MIVDRLEVIAHEQHLPQWDQARHVRLVRELAQSLAPETLRCDRQVHPGPFPAMVDVHRAIDVQITLLEFEPGQFLPHHNHPEMTGVMLCTSGSVAVDEYDEVPGPTDLRLIRFRGRAQLSRGRTTTLTSRDANIHRVGAIERSEVVGYFYATVHS